MFFQKMQFSEKCSCFFTQNYQKDEKMYLAKEAKEVPL